MAGQLTRTRNMVLLAPVQGCTQRPSRSSEVGLRSLKTTFHRWRFLLDQTFNLPSCSISHLVQMVDPKTQGSCTCSHGLPELQGGKGRKALPGSPAHCFLDYLCPVSQGGSEADISLKIHDKLYISYLFGPCVQ